VFVTLPSARASESTRDPKQLCLDASERGQNERDEGTYRAARESFMACARPSCPRVVLDSCTQWLRELDESAPTLVLGAKDEHGNDLTDVHALFDGTRFADVLDGKPLVADTGEHVLRFERDGSQPVEQRLVVRAGERARVVTVTMVSLAPPAPAPPAPAPPPLVEQVPQPEPPPQPEKPESVDLFHSPRFWTAGGLGVGAVVAVGLGAAFLDLAKSANDDAASILSGFPNNSSGNHCIVTSDPNCGNLSDKVNAHTRDVNIATGMFVGAGILAVGAVATWVLWPATPAPTPNASAWISPTPGGAAVGVSGAF
jgi:hypothetical protein